MSVLDLLLSGYSAEEIRRMEQSVREMPELDKCLGEIISQFTQAVLIPVYTNTAAQFAGDSHEAPLLVRLALVAQSTIEFMLQVAEHDHRLSRGISYLNRSILFEDDDGNDEGYEQRHEQVKEIISDQVEKVIVDWWIDSQQQQDEEGDDEEGDD